MNIKPYRILSKYDLSIYVDGNIQIFSDLELLFNLFSQVGISVFESRKGNLNDELKAIKRLKNQIINQLNQL